MIHFINSAKFDKQANILLLDEDQLKKKSLLLKDDSLKKLILSLYKTKKFSAKDSQIFPIIKEKNIILLVGIGSTRDLSLTTLRTTVKKALMSPYIKESEEIEIITFLKDDDIIKAIIEGVLIGTYSWDKYKTKEKDDSTPNKKNYFITAKKKKKFENIIFVCEGVNLARNLVNDNADKITSVYFEETIKKLIKNNKKISLEILNRKELKQKGLNLHLAVNQGSNKDPKLIIVKYTGASAKNPYTAIIGKGLTFDSGGLNLKPSGHMETMKMDMSGAAAIVGILKNTIALNLKKNIIFVCSLAENAISSNSYKPGDVIKSYSGKTVEIGNTDAEGRLVLADAISYIVKNYKPAKLIDLATLTGACIVALGYNHSALVSSDKKFSKEIIEASKITDDWVWQMPSYPELKNMVKSKIADICNISNVKGGGTITAAEFLRQFTEDTKWAHLDIAGTAYVENQNRLYFNYGATGAGVRLITQLLQNN